MDDATGAGETDLRPACPSLPPPMSISTGVASAVNMTGYDLLQALVMCMMPAAGPGIDTYSQSTKHI